MLFEVLENRRLLSGSVVTTPPVITKPVTAPPTDTPPTITMPLTLDLPSHAQGARAARAPATARTPPTARSATTCARTRTTCGRTRIIPDRIRITSARTPRTARMRSTGRTTSLAAQPTMPTRAGRTPVTMRKGRIMRSRRPSDKTRTMFPTAAAAAATMAPDSPPTTARTATRAPACARTAATGKTEATTDAHGRPCVSIFSDVSTPRARDRSPGPASFDQSSAASRCRCDHARRCLPVRVVEHVVDRVLDGRVGDLLRLLLAGEVVGPGAADEAVLAAAAVDRVVAGAAVDVVLAVAAAEVIGARAADEVVLAVAALDS